MHPSSIHLAPEDRLQLQFEGFLETHPLWEDAKVCDLEQFKAPPQATTTLPDGFSYPRKLPFGKRAEAYFAQSLRESSFHVVRQSVQLSRQGITIGEMDFLLQDQESGDCYHVELVCKFYLFDPDMDSDPISPWVGPNRRDSLQEKLTKLAKHQLPILHGEEAVAILKELNWDPVQVRQRVVFLADLFMPFGHTMDITPLNQECIRGNWLRPEQLEDLCPLSAQFIIPDKQDWSVDPKHGRHWMQRHEFMDRLHDQLRRERSPLCWMKNADQFKRFFVVWW